MPGRVTELHGTNGGQVNTIVKWISVIGNLMFEL